MGFTVGDIVRVTRDELVLRRGTGFVTEMLLFMGEEALVVSTFERTARCWYRLSHPSFGTWWFNGDAVLPADDEDKKENAPDVVAHNILALL